MDREEEEKEETRAEGKGREGRERRVEVKGGEGRGGVRGMGYIRYI
jgi:hypothetical protein